MARILIRTWGSILISFLIPVKGFAEMPLVERLKHLGFKCRHQQNGNVCTINRIDEKINSSPLDYSQPVAILVPDGVTERPKDMILYLHGFRGVCGVNDQTSPEKMVDQFHFLDQMKEAKATNSVMVFPMSRGKCETYNQELVGQFKQFTNWAELMVDPVDDRWVVAGHSGAGSVLANSLSRNPEFTSRVDGAILLDATYGMGGHNSQWVRASEANNLLKIVSVHTDGETGSGSESLRRAVGDRVVTSRPSRDREHCVVPNQFGKMLMEVRGGSRPPSPAFPPTASGPTQVRLTSPPSIAPPPGVPPGMTRFLNPFGPATR